MPKHHLCELCTEKIIFKYTCTVMDQNESAHWPRGEKYRQAVSDDVAEKIAAVTTCRNKLRNATDSNQAGLWFTSGFHRMSM